MDENDYEEAILCMQDEYDGDVQQVLTEDEKEYMKNKFSEMNQ